LHKILVDVISNLNFSGDLQKDSYDLLTYYNYRDVAEHSLKVAIEAKRIAQKFGIDDNNAFIAGCLHDIGNIFPNEKRIDTCRSLGVEVIEEECIARSLLHPKLSKTMANLIFAVEDECILSAIECHTTLKADAGNLDLVLFIADKLSWDEVDNQAFKAEVLLGLDKSLESAAFTYLRYLFDDRKRMKVVHPWTRGAYEYLSRRVGVL